MRNVFRQNELQNRFDQSGYVILPFLSAEEVALLRQAYFDTLPLKGGNITGEEVTTVDVKERITYDFTFIDKSIDYKKTVFDLITNAFKSRTDQYLEGYKPIIANFIFKSENDGEVPLHQNWAFVDESRFTSVSVWVPLVDSNEQNGTLQMVNGSHKRFGQIRGPLVPWELDEIKGDIIKNYLTPMNVQAGQAVILDDSIVHYSDINRTHDLRLAIQLIMIPEEAEAIHYHYDLEPGKSEVKIWEVDRDFFISFNPWKIPEQVKTIGTLKFSGRFIDRTEFDERFFMPRYDGVVTEVELPPVLESAKALHTPQPSLSKGLTINHNMHSIFISSEQQKHFDENGWVVIDLLSEDEVNDLLAFYHTHDSESKPKHGFYVSLDSNDQSFTQNIITKLTEVMGANANRFFKNYKLFTGSYVVKEPGKQGIVPPHQDWTFVDESQFFSATVWTPLVDVNVENGALGVISGSHRYFNHPRPSPAPIFKAPFDAHVFTVFPYLQVIELKAGQALVFNNRTIHASPPNVSDKPRIAAGIGLTHEDAQLIHCYMEPVKKNPTVGIYKVDQSFFPVYNNARLKTMYEQGISLAEEGWEKIAEVPLKTPELSADELVKKITLSGNTFNWSLANKMAALFGYDISGGTIPYHSKPEPSSGAATQAAPLPEKSEEWYEIYTPKRIVAEVIHKVSRAQENPEVYTPANMASELFHRIKGSKVLKSAAYSIAGTLLLRLSWSVLRFFWRRRTKI